MKEHEESEGEDDYVAPGDTTTWAELRDAFAEAESKLSLITGNGSGKVPMPVINELRYAGHHMLRAKLHVEGSEGWRVEIVKALRHVQRATFDVGAAGLPPLMGQFESFNSRYASLNIKNYFATYDAHRVRFRAIQKDLEHDGHKDRYALDAKMIAHLIEMREIVRWIDDEGEFTMAEVLRKERGAVYRQVATIIIALFALCAAATTACWSAYQLYDKVSAPTATSPSSAVAPVAAPVVQPTTPTPTSTPTPTPAVPPPATP